MKKIYLLAATALFAFTANAQFEDDFETYSTGDISSQSPLWRTWSDANGTAEDADVSSAEASNGSNSINIVDGNDMLLFFNQVGGLYTWQYKAYLSNGSSGFIGLQSTAATADFGLSLRHNDANVGTSFTLGGTTVGAPFVIPQDEWVTFTWELDLGTDTANVKMNGTVVYAGDLLMPITGTLEAVDLWAPTDEPTNFFMDEVRFVDGILGVDDFSSDVFSVFPNPVVNELTIKSASVIDNVTIYDVLGKEVLSVNPDAISPSVDMSALSSGAYLVNITIGNATKTVKVLK